MPDFDTRMPQEPNEPTMPRILLIANRLRGLSLSSKLRGVFVANRLRSLLIGGVLLFVMATVPVGLLLYSSSGMGDQQQKASGAIGDQQQKADDANLKPLAVCADGGDSHKREGLDDDSNGKIAFDHHVVIPTAGSVPEEDIWTVNPDGSNRVQLTANSRCWDETPAWSPDGRQIAFVQTDPADQPDLPAKLFVMNPDGSKKIELPLPEGVNAYDPTWSPDGDRIAFYSVTAGALYITWTDGSGTLIKLSTPGLPGEDAHPEWSPDSSQIAFTNSTWESEWSDIYVMNVSPTGDTSGLRQLTDHPLGDVEPSWSPDGTEIAFSTIGRAHPAEARSTKLMLTA